MFVYESGRICELHYFYRVFLVVLGTKLKDSLLEKHQKHPVEIVQFILAQFLTKTRFKMDFDLFREPKSGQTRILGPKTMQSSFSSYELDL